LIFAADTGSFQRKNIGANTPELIYGTNISELVSGANMPGGAFLLMLALEKWFPCNTAAEFLLSDAKHFRVAVCSKNTLS